MKKRVITISREFGSGGHSIEVTTLKLIDAFEDVYIGRYQQAGRFDARAKIMALRLMVSTALMCILISARAEIYLSLLGKGTIPYSRRI